MMDNTIRPLFENVLLFLSPVIIAFYNMFAAFAIIYLVTGVLFVMMAVVSRPPPNINKFIESRADTTKLTSILAAIISLVVLWPLVFEKENMMVEQRG